MKQILGKVIPALAMATASTCERVIPKPAWRTTWLEKGRRASRTPGSTKGPTCQTNPMKKFFLCHPHAWKHPQYGEWLKKSRIWVLGKAGGTG